MKFPKTLALTLVSVFVTSSVFARSLELDLRPMAEANQAFGHELLKRVAREELAKNANKNIFLSPLSASLALSMLINGAEGQTYKGIASTLSLGDMDLNMINATNAGLISKLAKGSTAGANEDDAFTLAIANSVWSNSNSPFDYRDSYVAAMSDTYRADVKKLDFKAEEAAGIVNGWASEKTNGKIPTVIDAETLKDLWFVLMNATYFKANWVNQFYDGFTKDADFTEAGGNVRKVKMMSQSHKFAYFENNSMQVVQLPYVGYTASMLVVLPKPGKSIQALLDSGELASEAFYKNFEEKSSTYRVELELPKFSFDYSLKMNDVLKAMGMADAFEDHANFSGIGSPATKVGLVKQDTFVKLDEKGTEAAAVTLIGGVEATSIPAPVPAADMKVNRPFAVVVVDNTYATPIFLGVVMSPDWK